MSSSWDWVEPFRTKHFSAPLGGLYAIERIEGDAYWQLHEAELRRYFPSEVYFDLKALTGEEGARARARLEASAGGDQLTDRWVARDGAAIAAMFSGHQKDAETYRMWHTHVHPGYRRRGLYNDILQRTLAYTRDLGFDYVVSDHAPSNNAVLIPKLKAGFRIMGLDIDARLGPSIHLKYFHHEAHLRAYEFRCGLATLDDAIIGTAFGAAPQLFEQIRRATEKK
jgi:GNAT superfamily N-acetyltransferase